MTRLIPRLMAATLVALATGAGAHEHPHDAAPACADPGLAGAAVATPLLARDGGLWLAWSAAGQVSLAHSSDLGHSFAPAMVLSSGPDRIDSNGDGRPVVAEDSQGRLVVAWARFKDEEWNAQVMVSSSTDGGASFSAPHALTDDPASQRFAALAADGRGGIFAAWIDKRTRAAAPAGHAKPGAALAYAWSGDGGASFGPGRVFHDGSCECCRLGVAMDPQGHPVVLFRSLFDQGVRDHAVVTFGDHDAPGPAYRVSLDNWAINGCPHHGPGLAIGATGTYHAAWFTQGPVREGLFYARSTDGGQRFSTPRALSKPDRHPARPAVLVSGTMVWLAWKEFDGHQATVLVMHSADDGLNWSAPVVVAHSGGTSDHPLLVGDDHRVFLSWLTHDEGYRLLPLESAP